jgi:hypothetical protein
MSYSSSFPSSPLFPISLDPESFTQTTRSRSSRRGLPADSAAEEEEAAARMREEEETRRKERFLEGRRRREEKRKKKKRNVEPTTLSHLLVGPTY